MEPDELDAAIDVILARADGDPRRALRAVLLEALLLTERLYASSEDKKPITKRSLQ